MTAVALLALAAPAGANVPDADAVLHVLNEVREDPADYGDFLRRAAEGYRGGIYAEHDGTEHATYEGEAAVRDAARALDEGSAVTALLPDPILTGAARDHAEAQGRAGGIGHVSSAGVSPGARARRRGGDIYVVEAVSYGMRTPEAVVRQWMVDDGVSGRGHRKMLMAPQYRYAGIWCARHVTRATMCVIDLSATPGGHPGLPPQR